MSKSLTLSSIALLLASAAPAFAASNVDLTVKGLITPSACTPGMSGNGIVDFGKISAKDLKPDSQTRLADKTLQLTVTCEASTLFALKPTDNRAGSSHNNFGTTYGLGLINGSEKLGRYFMSFSNPVSDIPLTALNSSDNGATWRELYDDDSVVPNQLFAFGTKGPDTLWYPEPLQSLTVEIALNTAIAPTNTLTLTNEVAMDGSATLEVIYL